jgi:DNA mismatch repair protein MLH3
VSSVIQSFLVRHGFASNQDHPKSRDSSPSPRKRRKLLGDEEWRSASLGALPDRNDEKDTEIDRKVVPVLCIRTVWIISLIYLLFFDTPQGEEGDTAKDEITWTDPVSGKTFTVDQRTGNSYLQGTGPGGRTDDGNTFQMPYSRRTLTDTRWFSQDDNDTLDEKLEIPSWIQKALQVENCCVCNFGY